MVIFLIINPHEILIKIEVPVRMSCTTDIEGYHSSSFKVKVTLYNMGNGFKNFN